MFKKKRIQIGALILSAAIILSATACGTSGPNGEGTGTTTKNEQTQKENVNPEWVYVPEYLQLDEFSNYSDKVKGDYLYTQESEWNEDTNIETTTIKKTNLLDQTKETVASFVGSVSGNSWDIDAENNLYYLTYIWDDDTTSDGPKQSLIKYTKDGTEVYNLDMTSIIQKENVDYINNAICDDKGRIFLNGENKVLLVDADGKYVGSVNVAGSNDWILGCTMGTDGKAYYLYYDNSGTGGSQKKMQSVDFDKKAVDTTYSGVTCGNSNVCATSQGTFYMSDSSALYEYDPATQTSTELFQWLDCDMNGENIQTVSSLSDGRILAVSHDWEEGLSEVAALKKTPGNEVTAKQVITVGTLSPSSELNRAAVKFNKANSQYRIKIKSYINPNGDWNENTYRDAVTALMNSITSADCPDILDTSDLDVAHLATKGLFEDMGTYLDQSKVLGREDYLQNVLDAYTFEGKLVGIPKNVSLMTLVGNSKDFGNKTGWTLEEMLDYAKQNSGKQLIELDKMSVVYMLMINNQDSFINLKTGECSFNSPDFIKILEFANTFPEEISYDEDGPSTPVKIQKGSLMMTQAYISSFTEIQMYDAMFNNQAAYIGYPTIDGSNGHMMTADTVYAITSSSANKEGAWSFIESILSDTTKERWSWGFSTNKNKLKNDIAEAIKVEYLTDENGEKFLDENGEPIIVGGGGMVSYGDWDYTEHVATQDEVDRTLEILNHGKLITSQDTQIMNIITEESAPYFKGQKSAGDVASVIQSRVQIYVDENF